MTNFTLAISTIIGLVLVSSQANAQQQPISEKVAGQSVAANAILNSAEKAGPVEVEREKINNRLGSTEPSFARIPNNVSARKRKPSKMNLTFAAIKKELERGDQFTARQKLAEFVYTWPANTHARLLLSKLEIKHGNYQQARSILLPMKLDENSDWQPWFWSGTARMNEGSFEHARADLEQALARDAKVVDIWIQQAVVEQQLNNHIGAIQLLQIAQQIAPGKPQVHLNLAFSNEHLGEFSTALQHYQRFLQTSADSKLASFQPKVIRRIVELSNAL